MNAWCQFLLRLEEWEPRVIWFNSEENTDIALEKKAISFVRKGNSLARSYLMQEPAVPTQYFPSHVPTHCSTLLSNRTYFCKCRRCFDEKEAQMTRGFFQLSMMSTPSRDTVAILGHMIFGCCASKRRSLFASWIWSSIW